MCVAGGETTRIERTSSISRCCFFAASSTMRFSAWTTRCDVDQNAVHAAMF
jgi:hypothetical protein